MTKGRASIFTKWSFYVNMDHDIDFKIGDLVYIISDCYVFMKERAKITSMGGLGVVTRIKPPEEYNKNQLMTKFWQASVEVEIAGGVSGWISRENLILVCNEDG